MTYKPMYECNACRKDVQPSEALGISASQALDRYVTSALVGDASTHLCLRCVAYLRKMFEEDVKFIPPPEEPSVITKS